MAMEYITKSKKVNGETIETKYRVDADFVPKEIADICMEFIENYCVANNQIEWLVKTMNITEYKVTRNKGKKDEYIETVKCDNYPFVNVRRDFVMQFFPKIIKGESANETWKERINRLYGQK
jgi:hypothetical protein